MEAVAAIRYLAAELPKENAEPSRAAKAIKAIQRLVAKLPKRSVGDVLREIAAIQERLREFDPDHECSGDDCAEPKRHQSVTISAAGAERLMESRSFPMGSRSRSRKFPLIAIEGVDASGKATTTEYVTRLLSEEYGHAQSFSFPAYNTPSGLLLAGHLRGDWRCTETPMDGRDPSIPIDAVDNMIVRQSLMTINRAELQAEIEAALELGPVVLDRWYASSLAYGVAEGLNPDWIRRISSVLLEPDAWILLDVDPEIAMKRRPTARDANERDFAKLHRVRRAYLELFAGGEEGARLALPNRPRPSDALRSVRPRIPSGKTVNWYVVDAELPQHIVRDTVWSIATYAVLLTKERA